MPSRRTTWLLVLAVFLFPGAGASRADLKITGTKDFQYRAFSITGSLNQFLVDHPTFLADRGFRQSLRLNVSGTLFDNVSVDIALDDTNDIEKDRKLLVRADGKDFSVTAGRLTLDFPGTRYLLFNKKALAALVSVRRGPHTLSVLAGRPEGDATRDFFRGRGAAAEYLLRNRPVVQGSEIVSLDGRLLSRGGDYDMDYEEGTLILNRRLLPVETTSSITVEYEAQSSGSAFRSTILGVRDQIRLPAWRSWEEPVAAREARGAGLAARGTAKVGARTAAGGQATKAPAGGRAKAPALDPRRTMAVALERAGQVRGHVLVAVALVRSGRLAAKTAAPAPKAAAEGAAVANREKAASRPKTASGPKATSGPKTASGPKATSGPKTASGTETASGAKPAKMAEPAILANFGLPGEPLPEALPTVAVTATAAAPPAKPAKYAKTAGPGESAEPAAAELPDRSPSPDPPPVAASAVVPSSLAGADRGRTDAAVLGGMVYGAPAPGPDAFRGPGDSSFPAISNYPGGTSFAGASGVPLPEAFGAPAGDAGMADRRTVGPPVLSADDHAGISFVLSTDSEPKGGVDPLASTANTTVSTATPRQLGVLGADLTYRLGGGWRVSGEVAGSILDPNRRIDDPISHGMAWDVALAHAGPRWDFRLSRQHLGPGFEAVGKREFVRLGEVADLSSDLDLTTVHSRFDLTRAVFVDSALELSQTNISRQAGRPERDFVGVGNGLSWVFQPQGRVLVRHREDVSDISQPGVPAAHVTRRVRGAAVTKPLGRMVAQVRGERIEDRGVEASLEGDTSTVAVSLGDASRRKYKWSVNAQDVRFADRADRGVRDALSLGALVDLSFSRFLNGSVSLLDRTETNLITEETQGTRTGEMRVRYQPFDGLNLNTKASAEERSRIVRQTADPLLALVPQKPGERTLVAERPVIATNASHTADWQPSKRWDHRASFRQRDEKEVGSGALLSNNHAASYRLRFAPGSVFRTTSEAEVGRSLSRVGNFDRDTWLLTEELLWALSSGLNIALTYNDSDQKDRKGPGRDRTTVSAANAERTLGRYFTGLARVAHTDRVQGGKSGENSVGMGLRYALPHDPLRLQLDGEVAGVDGINPAGTPFESRRHKAGVRVDGQPMKNLNVECALTWVRAGANALGDNGYNGWTIESKAFLDF